MPEIKNKRPERLKLAAALGLAIILVSVLVIPRREQATPAGDQAIAQSAGSCVPDPIVNSFPRSRVEKLVATSALLAKPSAVIKPAELPEVSLQEIIAHNPFRSSIAHEQSIEPNETAIEGETIDASGTSEEIPLVSIDGIITGGHAPAVLIGNRLYGVNDYLDSGWQIVAITPSAIKVRRSN